MTRPALLPLRAPQQGFSLIEGLVSILIFSFGVLALVGLQANSIKQSNNAKYRSDASMLADDLLGQMWVTDRKNSTLQTYATGGSAYATWLANDVPLTSLPIAAAPTVSVNPATSVVTVTISWKAPSEAAANSAHTYTVVAQIK